MPNEYDFTTQNIREQIAAILASASQTILSPDADADKKFTALLSRSCELMRLIEVGK